MVFSGCSVTYGTAAAVATGTGMNTEMGKIAGLLEGRKRYSDAFAEKTGPVGQIPGHPGLGCLRDYLCRWSNKWY